MADSEQEFPGGYVDKRRNNKGQDLGAVNKRITANTTNISQNDVSVGALRTRLAAINAVYYNAARLNQMNKNDMVYAIRMTDELGIAAAGSI